MVQSSCRQIALRAFPPPWAGDLLARKNKKHFVSPDGGPKRIGESWNFSCTPKFPPLLAERPDVTLLDLIKLWAGRMVRLTGCGIGAGSMILWGSLIRQTGKDVSFIWKNQ